MYQYEHWNENWTQDKTRLDHFLKSFCNFVTQVTGFKEEFTDTGTHRQVKLQRDVILWAV